MSNATNRWKHRHLTPTAQAFHFVSAFTEISFQCIFHFNYKSVEQKSNLKYWWETIWLQVALDLNNRSQIQVDQALLTHLVT